jgi:DNA repair protein RadD
VSRWPHQQLAFDEATSAILGGAKRICVTAPTGAGKTRMMIDLIEWATENFLPVALYTNRRMLLDQTKDVLEQHVIYPGMRASGYETCLLRDVQLCMTQTELSQVYQKKRRKLHEAKLVIIDEAHNQTADTMQRMMSDHIGQGAAIVGYTATPLDIGHCYDELIVAAKVSDCRQCGALVPAVTFAPDEPDLRHVKKYRVGDDLSEKDNAKVMNLHGIFGRIFDHWEKLNPEHLPTILFAPGVKESLWCAEQFAQRGIRAASIDGDNVWLDGEYYESNKFHREIVAEGSREGSIPVVCNRFVLREGIDWPWLRHGIFATVFGALTSFLQSGGRLLRAFPGKSEVTVQDHGGNFWRHGSLNENREWSLGDTNHIVTGMRAERLRNKEDGDKEPIVCPQCMAVRLHGKACHKCGYEHHSKSRMIVQANGELKEIKGDIFRPRRIKCTPETEQIWRDYYFRGKSKKWNATFNQVEALFFREQHYYPPRDLPNMPRDKRDWFRKVSDVPREQLIQREAV